jgi:pSer/pThr/pTyr-binding forkhead associated (FHA) protein
MTITLVDVNSSTTSRKCLSASRLYASGAEAGESDILFDGAKFPMVSRRHAELRCENGIWLLMTFGSSYGLFLNGQKVGPPQPLAAGNKIQVGKGRTNTAEYLARTLRRRHR